MTQALAFVIAAVAPFNLVCTGEASSSRGFLAQMENARQVTRTYRVDLEKGRFCVDDCLSTFPVAETTDTVITFDVELPAAEGDLNDFVEFVHRETGAWTIRRRVFLGGQLYVDMTRGDCSRAPFTGFPPRKF